MVDADGQQLLKFSGEDDDLTRIGPGDWTHKVGCLLARTLLGHIDQHQMWSHIVRFTSLMKEKIVKSF